MIGDKSQINDGQRSIGCKLVAYTQSKRGT